MTCDKFKQEVVEAELDDCRAAATQGKVGEIFGLVKGKGPSWHGPRGWEASAVSEHDAQSTLLGREGRLEAGGWGKTELHRQTFKELGEFVRLPAGLVVATVAAMWGHWQTSTVAAERQIAEEMAKAACMVPSLFAFTMEQQATALHLLVEWATLETRRPYPLETVGRGVGRDRSTTTAAWRKRKVRVRVSWADGEDGEEQMVERVWDFSHTVHALKLWVATEWPSVKDARKVVVHGGGWGSEDGDRQLAESMQLGRLWGAEQGVAEVHIRKGECPTGDSLELVAGYVGAPRHRRWQYQPEGGGGGALGRALLMSPDNTIMQVPPVWLRWLHQHLGVTHEWCTSWYGMGRVMGVSSRLVGSPPESLIGGGVERAWDYQVGKDQRGESAHGVVMLRGWARTGHRAPGGQREGYIAPLFQHLVRELAAADKHQYMFVAVHEEGQETIEKALKEVQAQVMLKVPDGRMGHREAWWPLDKFVDNANDWADQRRELPNPRKEAVWLVRLGHGQWGQEAKVGSDRQLALEQLEDLGTRYMWQAG